LVELIFFTTNLVKLAHLRYLGRELGVHVIGFRRKKFYASYTEPPYIIDREQLLRMSFESALDQWKKAGMESPNRRFFLEDTSVRIDALSAEKDVPGVDVKYWMKNMTFGSLDQLLKGHGNNRRATVRSDIILYASEETTQLQGAPARCLWVHGETHGVIDEVDRAIETNLVYPWLDNKSFNRWFIPDGAEVPISLLPIAEANRFDFRRRSFEEVVRWLRGHGFVAANLSTRQLSLDL
jgi:inosine/xanthosine triphosphate pyrophosphatase family protein